MITHEELLRNVLYEKDTGKFFRTVDTCRWKSGEIKQTPITTGYLRVCVLGERHLSHRLAYFYMTGEWPKLFVDHINGDRSDNRWENLRLATKQQNQCNIRAHKDSRTGMKGVWLNKRSGRWEATLQFNRKRYWLGLHDTQEQAAEAYMRAAKELQGEFYCAA